MTRTLAIQAGLGIASGTAGLIVLLRPSAARGLLRMQASEAATYAMRIAGMMLVALGLFLTGFALAFASAGGVA
ncbi:hypothetical protein [Sphingomonas pituitosa]|uniref:hypothetical protein n=1 Tax=Sphingomonas pituitosa TaxID=99597 RepID=UPI000835779B|nr:hypothetical protein [Sphingomonas pituitosa]